MYPSSSGDGVVFVPHVVFGVDDNSPLESGRVEEERKEVGELAAAASTRFEKCSEVAMLPSVSISGVWVTRGCHLL